MQRIVLALVVLGAVAQAAPGDKRPRPCEVRARPTVSPSRLVEAYTCVGKKLQALEETAAKPFWARYRRLNLSAAIRTETERRGMLAELAAIAHDLARR